MAYFRRAGIRGSKAKSLFFAIFNEMGFTSVFFKAPGSVKSKKKDTESERRPVDEQAENSQQSKTVRLN